MQTSNTERVGARTWAIWFAAAMVYLLAVFHRTSFGVAGLAAAERFGVGAAALATFTVLQIGVYAAMQIPTGVLVDRFGPRSMLTAALLFGSWRTAVWYRRARAAVLQAQDRGEQVPVQLRRRAWDVPEQAARPV